MKVYETFPTNMRRYQHFQSWQIPGLCEAWLDFGGRVYLAGLWICIHQWLISAEVSFHHTKASSRLHSGGYSILKPKLDVDTSLIWQIICAKDGWRGRIMVNFGWLQVVWSGVLWCGQEVCQGIAMCKIFFGMMCKDLVNGENRLLYEGKIWYAAMHCGMWYAVICKGEGVWYGNVSHGIVWHLHGKRRYAMVHLGEGGLGN